MPKVLDLISEESVRFGFILKPTPLDLMEDLYQVTEAFLFGPRKDSYVNQFQQHIPIDVNQACTSLV